MSGRIPTTVFTGATGAGKTALIARLLLQRMETERWAVLQNDFGRDSSARLPAMAEGGVVVRQVSGCICCTGRVALRTGLIALVRTAQPRRLLIEASALAEPAAILAVLDEPGIASAVELKALVCAVAPRQLADQRYAGNELYRGQIASADLIVLAESSEAERRAARAALAGMIGPETAILDSGNLALSALDLR